MYPNVTLKNFRTRLMCSTFVAFEHIQSVLDVFTLVLKILRSSPNINTMEPPP